jgi:hypothetical protein
VECPTSRSRLFVGSPPKASALTLGKRQGQVFILHSAFRLVKSEQAVAQTKIFLSGSLKRFLPLNLGEAEDMRYQLFEPEGRVLISPGASLRFIKKRFRTSEKGFGQQPVKT